MDQDPLSAFVIDYTIHFDDTMAYGGHHFLTSFKFQCAARESFLFGERVFDVPGVRDALDQVHLLTSDAYARNLHSTQLGDRVAIFLTLEDWGRVSARFCYRVIDALGHRVCAGFQTLICADAKTGDPMPMPPALRKSMDAMREIEEPHSDKSFRDRVLSGGGELDAVFSNNYIDAATQFLSKRYPSPAIIKTGSRRSESLNTATRDSVTESDVSIQSHYEGNEAWLFSGQGAFDAKLFCERVIRFKSTSRSAEDVLSQCVSVASEILGGDAKGLCSGSLKSCERAVLETPLLSQVGIHLQNVLGARLRQLQGGTPSLLVGHSFGEIAALAVAECFDLPMGVQIVCSRARAIQQDAPENGGLLVVFTPRYRIETEIKLLGLDRVCIAGRNHEMQTVASGPLDQLGRLGEYFGSVGVSTVRVPSPAAFHHPELQSASASWLAELREIDFKPPKTPVYSPIGRRFLGGGDDIAAVLASQLLRPFDFQGALSDAIKAGVTRFVDCGSTGSLANLISNALPKSGEQFDPEMKAECPQVLCCADEESNTASGSGSTDDRAVFAPTTRPASVNENGRKLDAAPIQSRNGNANALRQHQSHQMGEATEIGPETANAISVATTPTRVSIVGCGCILPGGARSPERLFTAITEQRLGIVDQREFDPHWSEDFYSETLVPDRSTSHLSGRVDDDDIFAPSGIPAVVFAKWTRSQQLLGIALNDCVESLKGAERIVCLIGATADGFEDQDEVSSLLYAGIDPRDSTVNERMNTARSYGRTPHDAVQEVFDQMIRPGIDMTLIDAACASSLYTVALGMRLLENGQADAVIAGGCFCPGRGNSCLFSQFRGTTSTGCRPFDSGADGVVFSEGAAVVTLRRTDDAQRFGLNIEATLSGAGLSSDGRSSSANVPQSNGQILSLERCYANYGIKPSSIQAIEAHGTSTPVGDSTEVETLRRFFVDQVDSPIPIHSLKSNLGHAGWAAGTASIIAACQYMKRRRFPGQAFHHLPSQALQDSSGTLKVTKEPVVLSQPQLRLAVDGFGFGGANAHLVLESHSPNANINGQESPAKTMSEIGEDEFVFVACHRIEPELNTITGRRFDRDKKTLPSGMLVLPDLLEDMDISQILAVNLAHHVVSQLTKDDDQLKQDTSIVLAMSGKTERGIEATTRIMTQRFRRQLAGHEELLSSLEDAHQRARPSRSYTLQCMMPNVASGRAALLLDLNGPNFVVDAGSKSLEAAVSSAALLLKDGSRLAIVAAVDANSLRLPAKKSGPSGGADNSSDEFAAAFGMTTKAIAEQHGWSILSTVTKALEELNQSDGSEADISSDPVNQCRKQVDRLVESLTGVTAKTKIAATESLSQPDASSESDCRIHAPVWVEKQAEDRPHASSDGRDGALVAIVSAETDSIAELIKVLPQFCERGLIVVVGESATEKISYLDEPNLVAVDLGNEASTAFCLDVLDSFQADSVVVVRQTTNWGRSETLNRVATDNCLCEFLFLLAQRYFERLDSGRTELWGLFAGGWKSGGIGSGVVHPESGAVAGLLKSIQREIPASRMGTVCTERGELQVAMRALAVEQSQVRRESEVVYQGSTRMVRRLRPTALAANVSPQVTLNQDSVVIASGGARGVTAVMLEALVRDHQCTVIALGRSPLEAGPENPDSSSVEQDFYRAYLEKNPGSTAIEMKRSFESTRARWEAHQTIESLKRFGGRVEYCAVDVTDSDEVGKVVKEIASRFGRADLLIHGAGVQFSKRLKDRSLAEFRKTYQVKVAGLNHLVSSCSQQFGKPIATHVLTSAYSVFGNDGQHDYGAANETMDRLCAMGFSADQPAWTSLAWLAWDAVGMTRGSEYRALSKQRSLSGITPEIGQKLFRDVMAGRTGTAINVPLSDAEHVKYELSTVPSTVDLSSMSTQGFNGGNRRVLERSIKLDAVECLESHLVRSTPTLPGAWITDFLVGTAMTLYPDSGRIVDVVVEDMAFMRFVRLVGDCDPNARVVVEQAGDSVNAVMMIDVLHPTGYVLAKDVVCASARLTFSWEEKHIQSDGELVQSAVSAAKERVVVDPYCEGENSIVDLSGAFDCLKEIQVRPCDRNATFSPDPKCWWAGSVPALLLDAAWRVGAMYTDGDPEKLFVPVKIGRMTLPMNGDTQFSELSGWRIYSTAPTVGNAGAEWRRTEIFDQDGTLRMLVENAFAAEMN